MSRGSKGLYWRRQGGLRYFTARRIKRLGLGKPFSKIERLRRDGLTTGVISNGTGESGNDG